MMYFFKLKQALLKNGRMIASFLGVGALTAIFYFSLFNLLWKILGLNYQIAISIAYVTAILLYFFVNRSVTFRNKDKAIGLQLTKFLAMVIMNYLITLAIVHSMVEILTLPPNVGLMVAIIVTTLSNYIIARYWIFADVDRY